MSSSEFLRIANDPNATDEQRRTVAALIDYLRPSWEENDNKIESDAAKLESREWLNLQGSDLEDLSPIANLHNLKGLVLTGRISDLSVIASIPNLERLELGNNYIRDLTPLRNLSKLRILRLSNNRIRDLSPLFKLRTLETLNVEDNQIEDISGIHAMANLVEMSLSRNKIHMISGVSEMPSMRILELNENEMSDASGIEVFSNLCSLSLTKNNLDNLEPISKLHKLTFLSLSGNSISNVNALRALRLLRCLTLHGNPLHDVTALEGLPFLHQLFVDEDKLVDKNVFDRIKQAMAPWDSEFFIKSSSPGKKITLTVSTEEYEELCKPPFGLDDWDHNMGFLGREIECLKNRLAATLTQHWSVYTPGMEGEYSDFDLAMGDDYAATRHLSFGIQSAAPLKPELFQVVQEFLGTCKNPWLISIGSGFINPWVGQKMMPAYLKVFWHIKAFFVRLGYKYNQLKFLQSWFSESDDQIRKRLKDTVKRSGFDIFVTKDRVIVR